LIIILFAVPDWLITGIVSSASDVTPAGGAARGWRGLDALLVD